MLAEARRRPAVGHEPVLAVHRLPEEAERPPLDLVVESGQACARLLAAGGARARKRSVPASSSDERGEKLAAVEDRSWSLTFGTRGRADDELGRVKFRRRRLSLAAEHRRVSRSIARSPSSAIRTRRW